MPEAVIPYVNPDKQTDRANFDFVRMHRAFLDESTNDLSLRFLDLACELGLPDDLPVPPRGLPGFNRRPDLKVMNLIRAGVGYALAVASGEHRAAWLRYQEIDGALRGVWHEGRCAEIDAAADKRAELAATARDEAARKLREAKVYFIQTEAGQIKIGMAVDPQARLRGLQTSHPARLVLLATTDGGQSREREYHERFAAHRLHGEWFQPHADILAEIDRLNATPRPLPRPVVG